MRDVEVVEREFPLLTSKEVNSEIKKRLRRKLVVVGACIGTDAHTVGIDAILNIKGFAGEKGLEYYREMPVVNLGAQVLVPDLVNTAREERADAVLVVAGRHPEGRPHPQHDGDVGGLPRGLPRRHRCRCSSSAARASRRARAGRSGSTGSSAAGTTPGEVASYLVQPAGHARTDPDPRGAQR